jgi:hypothetical protein
MFVILRHVRTKEQNRLWKRCAQSVRTHFPGSKIVMIDDHSDPSAAEYDPSLYDEYIQSDFWGAGECLPYYYFWKYK